MPNRIIREDLIESDRYQSVSIEAKLAYVHLLLLADDFGCVSVSPAFLRRRCFFNSPPDDRITRILLELVDVDLIRTYEVDRHALAYIPRYRQRLQRSTLKHPKPPENLYKDDADAVIKFNNINEKNQFSAVGQQVSNGLPTEAQQTKRSEEKGREEKRSEGKGKSEGGTQPSPPTPAKVKPGLEIIEGKTHAEWLLILGIEVRKDWTAADAKLAVENALAARKPA